MVDLPKIKTELTGDISDLAKAFLEAKALRDAWLRDQQTSMEEGGKAAGKKSAAALLDEFQKEIKGRKGVDYSITDMVDEKFQAGLQDLFGKMGRASASKFTGEFDSLLHGSGMAQRIVGEFNRYDGSQQIEHVGQSWFDRFKAGFSSGVDTLGQSMFGGWAKAANDPQTKKMFQDLGKQFNADFSGGFLSGIGNLMSTPAGAIVIGGAIGAALSSAAAMSGGLLGSALGLGGIAAAIYGGIQNPAVHTALVTLGTDLKTTLTNSMAGADSPLISAFTHLDNFFNTGALGDAFKPIFAAIFPFEQSLEKFFDAIGPKLAVAMQQAMPILQQFFTSLPDLGGAIGDFFIKVTTEVQANREGIKAFIDLLGTLLVFLGNFIEQFAKIFDVSAHAFDIWITAIDDVYGTVLRLLAVIPPLGSVFGWTATQIGQVRTEADGLVAVGDGKVSPMAEAVAKSIAKANTEIERQAALVAQATDRWDAFFGVSMNVDNANLALHTSMTALTDSIDQNGHSWKLNTKEGQANYGAVTAAIQAAHDYRQAEIDSGTSMQQANKEYQTNIDWILQQAQNAGMDAGSINQLRVQVDNLINSINELNRIPKATPGGWSQIPFMSAEGSFIPSFAGGGFTPFAGMSAANGFLGASSPGTLVMAGEPQTGGEWIIPRRGISQQRAAALVGSAANNWGLTGGGGGGGTVHLQATIPVYLNGKQVAQASYEDFVDYGQERKYRRGSTGF